MVFQALLHSVNPSGHSFKGPIDLSAEFGLAEFPSEV